MSPHRRVISLAALTGSLLLLASCGSGSSVAGEGPSANDAACDAAAHPEASSTFPVEIDHALGTTTIEQAPERVASIGWGNQDVALALGIAPVGSDDQTWSMTGDEGLGLYDWTLDAYDELCAPEPAVFETADGVDFEAIADAQPEVILAGYSGLTADEYETLSKIAPTVAYPEIPWYTPWREAIEIDSAALGLAAEGDELVADLDQRIAEATADIDSFEGKTAAFFYVTPSDLSVISIYATGDARTAFLGDLGFDFPQLALDVSEKGEFYTDIAAENADIIDDVDVMVLYGDDQVLAEMQDDPLWSTVPAVQNGAVVAVGSGDAFSGSVTPTALSIPWMLDDYVALLDDAASHVE